MEQVNDPNLRQPAYRPAMNNSLHRNETPVVCLRQGAKRGERGKKAPEPGSESDRGDRGKALLCKACRHKITSQSARMSVNGKHAHVFFNPHGYVFDIGCFSAAPGVSRMGPAVLEHTWFAGHSWQVAICARCGKQMGWYYTSGSGGGFFGLILSNLVEGDDDT